MAGRNFYRYAMGRGRAISKMLDLNGNTKVSTGITLPGDSTPELKFRIEADYLLDAPQTADQMILYTGSYWGIYIQVLSSGVVEVHAGGGTSDTITLPAEASVLHIDYQVELSSSVVQSAVIFLNGEKYVVEHDTTPFADLNIYLMGRDTNAKIGVGSVKNFYYSEWETGAWVVKSNKTLTPIKHKPPMTVGDGISLADTITGQTAGSVVDDSGVDGFGSGDGWVNLVAWGSRYSNITNVRDATTEADTAVDRYSSLSVNELAATSQAIFDMAMATDVWDKIVELYPFCLNSTDMFTGMRGNTATNDSSPSTPPSDAASSYDGVVFTAGTDYLDSNILPSALGDGDYKGGMGVWMKDFTYGSGHTKILGSSDLFGTRDDATLEIRNDGTTIRAGVREAGYQTPTPSINHYDQILNDLLYVNSTGSGNTNGSMRLGTFVHNQQLVASAPSGNNAKTIRIWGNVDFSDHINSSDGTMSFAIFAKEGLNQSAFRSIMIKWLTALGQTGAGVATGSAIGDSNTFNVYSNGTPIWDGWDLIIGSARNLDTNAGNGAEGGSTFDLINDKIITQLAAYPSMRYVYMSQGTNDIDDGLTFDQLKTSFTTEILDYLNARSIRLVVISTPPNANRSDAEEEVRVLWNDWLAEQGAAGVLEYVDVYTILEDPAVPDQLNPLYELFEGVYSPDGTHFAEDGHIAVADEVNEVILKLES